MTGRKQKVGTSDLPSRSSLLRVSNGAVCSEQPFFMSLDECDQCRRTHVLFVRLLQPSMCGRIQALYVQLLCWCRNTKSRKELLTFYCDGHDTTRYRLHYQTVSGWTRIWSTSHLFHYRPTPPRSKFKGKGAPLLGKCLAVDGRKGWQQCGLPPCTHTTGQAPSCIRPFLSVQSFPIWSSLQTIDLSLCRSSRFHANTSHLLPPLSSSAAHLHRLRLPPPDFLQLAPAHQTPVEDCRLPESPLLASIRTPVLGHRQIPIASDAHLTSRYYILDDKDDDQVTL